MPLRRGAWAVTGKRAECRACPWCGRCPYVGEYGVWGRVRVQCVNSRCAIQAWAFGRDVAQAIRRWNKRAPAYERALGARGGGKDKEKR